MSGSNEAPSILVLPEECTSEILSLTSPRDACRAAAISKAFNTAANSDAVWEQFLPPDYRGIMARAASPVDFGSKKELYLLLSESHVLLDGDRLAFKLDKESGRKCYMLRARDLEIAWHDDPRYWEWKHVPESRFAEVGILREVWWLDIRGVIPSAMLSRNATYAAYLVFQITREARGLGGPVTTIVGLGGIRNEKSNVYIMQLQAHTTFRVPPSNTMRKDGWMEIELGEFYSGDGDEGEVEMVFKEHRNWKTGLIVEGIEIRPK